MKQRSIGFALGILLALTNPLGNDSAIASTTDGSSPTPAVYLARVGFAVAGSSSPKSILLTGTVAHDANRPTPVADPISLKIDFDGRTQMTVSAPAGAISETWTASGSTGVCTSTLDTRTAAITPSNCWNSASWILPKFALANSTVSARLSATSATVTQDGNPVLQVTLQIPATGHSASIGQYITTVSSRTVYLDPNTLLPISMTYSEHPGFKTYAAIPVRVVYSDYRTVNGVTVPFHILKTVAGHTTLDITIDSVIATF